MSKIGFVGLGIMGTPMTGHLIVGGHELFLYDIKPVPKQAVVTLLPSLPLRPPQPPGSQS